MEEISRYIDDVPSNTVMT